MKAIGREVAAEITFCFLKNVRKMYEKCMRDAVLVEFVEKIEKK